MWTRVKVTRGGRVAPKRTTFGVSRLRTGTQSATLLIPSDAVRGEFVSVYTDGNGKIAFAFGDKGDRRIYRPNKASHLRAATIPLHLASLIPFGTRDAAVYTDGDMLVLDTAQFRLSATPMPALKSA